MNFYSLIKVLHILAVTAVIAGVVGRALIRARLVRLDDIHFVREFVVAEKIAHGFSAKDARLECFAR